MAFNSTPQFLISGFLNGIVAFALWDKSCFSKVWDMSNVLFITINETDDVLVQTFSLIYLPGWY